MYLVITSLMVCMILGSFYYFKKYTHYVKKDNILSNLLNDGRGYCLICLCYLVTTYMYAKSNNLIIFYEDAIFTALLIFISLIDIEYMVLPNKIVIPSIIICILYKLFTVKYDLLNNIEGLVVGGFILFILILISILLFGKGALGGGDMKFNALIGAMIGFPAVCNETIISFILAGAVIIFLVFFKLIKIGQHTNIPYSPFFTVGTIIILLWH